LIGRIPMDFFYNIIFILFHSTYWLYKIKQQITELIYLVFDYLILYVFYIWSLWFAERRKELNTSATLIVAWMKGTLWSAGTTIFVITLTWIHVVKWVSGTRYLMFAYMALLTRQSLLNCPYDYAWRQLWTYKSYKM